MGVNLFVVDELLFCLVWFEFRGLVDEEFSTRFFVYRIGCLSDKFLIVMCLFMFKLEEMMVFIEVDFDDEE